MRFIIAVFVMIVGLTQVSYSSDPYYFNRLDINNGLSQNCVNVIIQDRNGFMWFGTRDGLNRYDGLSFKVFRNDFTEGNGLKNNFITSLFEDCNGNIWVGTDVGVCIYYPEQERFEEFKTATEEGKKIERTVTKIGEGRSGRILIAVVNSGLFEYDLSTEKLINYDPTAEYGNIREFAVENNGRIWVSFYRGFFYTNDEITNLQCYKTADGQTPFYGETISTIHFGSHNKMYLGSERNGVYEVNLVTNSLRKLKLNSDGSDIFVRDIISDGNMRLWIGSEKGVYIYDIEDGGYKNLTSIFFDPYSISDNAIYSIYMDRNEDIWLGSFFGGVNYHLTNDPNFNKYYPTTNKGSLKGRRIREICGNQDGSKLWVGTEDAGLFSFDLNTKQFEQFQPSIDFPNIHGLCLDGDDLWVGTFSYGVKVINTVTGKIKSYSANQDQPFTIRDNYVFSIYKASTGHIYIGTANFLIRYDKDDESFVRIQEVEDNLFYDIKEDSNGNLWVATYSNGIYIYDSKLNNWEHYTHSNQQGSLPINKILSVFEDSKKNMWVTTQGGGFCRFVPETKTFKAYDSTNGLPNDVVFQMKEDESGILWLTTNKGLVEFDPDYGVVKVYTTTDGLLEGQFNYKSSYKDKNENIYFGTTQGMISFNHKNVRKKQVVFPIYIMDFFLFNQSVVVGEKESPLKKSIIFSDKITLKYNQNTFSFRVASLDYSTTEAEELIYKLEGLDKEWQPLPHSSTINYSKLPYGRYKLRIKSLRNTLSDQEERRLDIEIKPPFYLTNAAFVIYPLLVCLLIYQIYTYLGRRNRRKQQSKLDKFEQEKEKELYNSKINFFTNLTHEIRTPLTLIKSPLENILAKDTVTDRETMEDMRIMKQNVNRLHDLTNQLLDFRHVEKENIVLNYVKCDVSHTVREIYNRFSPLAKQKGYDFSLDTGAAALFAAVDIEALTKIVSNLFNNAIKYGDSYIRITLGTEQIGGIDYFDVSVENDGETLPDEVKEEIFKPFVRYTTPRNNNIPGTGIGLSLAKSLAEQHNGTLNVETYQNMTRFKLTLPIEQAIPSEIDPETIEMEMDFSNPDLYKTDNVRPTILLVEDEISLQKFISRQLAKKYNVVIADNGENGIKALSEHMVDLVVSDIMMPVMDGIELCSIIKSNINYSHIPVVLLTAKTMMQSKIEGAEAGADSYIEKPFSTEYLLAVIENLIKNRALLKKTFSQYPMAVLSNMTTIAKADEDLLHRLHDVILLNISNPDLKMENIAETLNMSRASFYRKIKGLLDLSPNEYLRVERLKEAARLLRDGDYQVSEVCYMVGFSSSSYFSKCFYKQYGILPKDFS